VDAVKKYMLFLDYDGVDLEFVLMDLDRLLRLCPDLGDAMIYRTDGGYHVVFPKSRLTAGERNALLLYSRAHYGFKWFTIEVDTATLRFTRKPTKGSCPPIYIASYSRDRGLYYRKDLPTSLDYRESWVERIE